MFSKFTMLIVNDTEEYAVLLTKVVILFQKSQPRTSQQRWVLNTALFQIIWQVMN